MKIILDTGPLVALLNGRDSHHAWAVEALNQIEPPLWTCEAVLTEAAHLTGQSDQLIARVATGALRIGLEIEENAEHLQRLIVRYANRMDLADACIVRMTEIFPQSKVMTLDRTDFEIYRRNGRDVIPLLVPER